MNINKFIAILLIGTVVWSCGTQKKVDNMDSKKKIIEVDYSVGPTTYIYKTKNDYGNLVPVTLSNDKTKISSFPHPKDVYFNGELAYPTQLEEGYLLDNRGISSNVAFLNITYVEYSKLEKAPSADSLYFMIIDNDPLVELYNCGNRYQYKDEINELNNMIIKKQLSKCKKVVID
jgi:hypothetical protein